jgi:hypothetical protein
VDDPKCLVRIDDGSYYTYSVTFTSCVESLLALLHLVLSYRLGIPWSRHSFKPYKSHYLDWGRPVQTERQRMFHGISTEHSSSTPVLQVVESIEHGKPKMDCIFARMASRNPLLELRKATLDFLRIVKV